MLHVQPEDSLIDEKVAIKICYSTPHERVTLRCETIERNYVYDSHAYFICDYNGEVDLSTSPSFGGSYKGIDSMGIFSSMLPAKHQMVGLKYQSEDCRKPCKYKLQVYKGCVEDDEFDKYNIKTDKIKKLPICEKIIYRRFCAANVLREEISYGKVRAVLYKPNHEGPFKGVIDIYGGGGGFMDIKAPLFASHGFAALVLPFFRYKDLPKDAAKISLEYFLEAIEYFNLRKDILPGIALAGLSWGGNIVMYLASVCKDISCVVSINGGYLPLPLPYKGTSMPTKKEFYEEYTFESKGKDERGGLILYLTIHDTDNVPERFSVKLENTSAKIMIISGEDDTTFHPKLGGERFKERMKKHGKEDQVILLTYPGAGHFIEPPYLPQTLVHYNPTSRVAQSSGGEEVRNAMACIHSWKEILHFLQVYTGCFKLVEKSKL